MIMSFGKLTFEAGFDRMFSPGDIKRTLGISKEDQDQESGKPATLIKGVKLEKFSCKVKLLRTFDPRPEAAIKQLVSLVEARRPDKLVLGGVVVGKYKWLLTALDIDYTQMDGRGRVVEATVSLSFEEYVKEGAKKAAASAVGISSPGVSTTKANDVYKAKEPTQEDKAFKKRTVMEKRLGAM